MLAWLCWSIGGYYWCDTKILILSIVHRILGYLIQVGILLSMQWRIGRKILRILMKVCLIGF